MPAGSMDQSTSAPYVLVPLKALDTHELLTSFPPAQEGTEIAFCNPAGPFASEDRCYLWCWGGLGWRWYLLWDPDTSQGARCNHQSTIEVVAVGKRIYVQGCQIIRVEG
jgi:hypothetical protein